MDSVLVSSAETFSFVLPEHEALPPETRPTFECRTLTGREKMRVERCMVRGHEAGVAGTVSVGADAIDALAEESAVLGLVGWAHIPDPAKPGQDRPWPGSGAAACDALEPKCIRAIGLAVWTRSRVSEAQKKV